MSRRIEAGEGLKRWRRAGCAAAVLACVLPGCARTSDGVPIAADIAPTPTQSTQSTPTPTTEMAEPGILPTERTPVPAGSTTCPVADPPPVSVVASVPDPSAPKITVAVPAEWSVTKGEGDVATRLQGPDGESGSVTIAATTLDPAAAFGKYADDVMAQSAVSTVSVLPADLCGYSGQKLLGGWSDSPQQAIEFGDRIAHIWTGAGSYLVAVHVQGPALAPDFDPFTSPLMDDFGVDIP